eukprot:TRINITY_DN21035_c0_g1_i1.p1 TRINITY_DN21035_c0_g1~~TRINITY_DN21035_c0_g1_i1.p1  ORF type:complete len:763 (+),score=226.92 TRINITY_DN21035_c0_g1_i1:85-2289(+)
MMRIRSATARAAPPPAAAPRSAAAARSRGLPLGATLRGAAEGAAQRADPLLQPLRIRGVELRNRVLSTSHAPAYCKDGFPQERYVRYHEEKAKGGLGLSMFGGSSTVSPDSPATFGQIDISTDAVIPHLRRLADAVHAHGAATMCQISHMGRRTEWDVGDWLSPVAPSRTRESAHRAFPKEMELHDIRRVVRDYGRAALRCKQGGLDGVELSAAGHLIDSFWSPRVNRRQDGYGGSLESRARFALEVIEEVRRVCGGDFVVGMRMVGGPVGQGGAVMEEDGDVTHEECLEIARMLCATGMLDFLNINAGHIDHDNRLASAIPGMSSGLAPALEVAHRFKRAVGVPVFHACRIMDLSTARHAVREGMIDMVGMTRAHIADPHIVRKMREGREDTIRLCVGAGYCLDRIYVGKDALCIQNAATGREYLGVPHVIPKAAERRRVVVVGGGPGGMEAARVSAERGHQVTVLEAGSRLGGQIRLAQRAPWRKDLTGIADWLASELERLGVDVRFDTYAEKDDVLALEPDVVIIATGGVPDTLGQEAAVSVWDVLAGDVAASKGQRAVVYDGTGTYQAPSCAEHLAQQGLSVQLVTADRNVAVEMGALNWPIFLRNLYRLGVTITPDHSLRSVVTDGAETVATFRNDYTGATVEHRADIVVVEHGTTPSAELYEELCPLSRNAGEVDLDALLAVPSLPQRLVAPGGGGAEAFQLFRVGDAVASRNIHAAIYDSLRLCKDL